MSLPEFGPWPDYKDRTTFEARIAYNFPLIEPWGAAVEVIADQVKADAEAASRSEANASQSAQTAESAKDAAMAATNLLGAWSGLSDPVSIGDSVVHDSAIWLAVSAISDPTTSEPSLSNSDWQIISDMLGEEINALGTLTGGTVNIDCTQGSVVTATISTSTQTFTVSNIPQGRAYGFIMYLSNGGSQTINWFSGVQWGNAGSAPILTESGLDRIIFDTHDNGTTWTATAVLDIQAVS